MLEPSRLKEWAEALDRAEAQRMQVRQFSRDDPDLTIDDAYAVQRAWVDLKRERGRCLKGHKIGLTSRAMQRSSHIDEPDYGALLDDMFFENGTDIPMGRFIVPRVETELAFILKERLCGPECSIFDVLQATDYIVPALEIIDARIEQVDRETGARRKVVDTISDNAANAGVVLGGRPFRPFDLDVRWVSALLFRNSVIEESGVAAAVLNHPANGPAWLANKLHRFGETLEPGEIVLAGSFTAPVAVHSGDTFHADYGPVGSISIHFV